MAVTHCSNAQAGGWYLQFKRNEQKETWLDKSASEKDSPLGNHDTLLARTSKQWVPLSFFSMYSLLV